MKMPFVSIAAAVALSGLALSCPPAAVASQVEASDRLSYVLLEAGGQSSTMSGSMDDLRRAKALRVGREALLYVRDGGGAYVIRDPATLAQAAAIFEPQRAMGARQAELGARQAALGTRQARLGSQQARLGAQQATATPGRAVALGRQQAELGRQQDALGGQQNALGEQQSALGREQSRLGREAEAKIRALVADAIRRGLASPIS